jgi:hypothetical protein
MPAWRPALDDEQNKSPEQWAPGFHFVAIEQGSKGGLAGLLHLLEGLGGRSVHRFERLLGNLGR